MRAYIFLLLIIYNVKYNLTVNDFNLEVVMFHLTGLVFNQTIHFFRNYSRILNMNLKDCTYSNVFNYTEFTEP